MLKTNKSRQRDWVTCPTSYWHMAEPEQESRQSDSITQALNHSILLLRHGLHQFQAAANHTQISNQALQKSIQSPSWCHPTPTTLLYLQAFFSTSLCFLCADPLRSLPCQGKDLSTLPPLQVPVLPLSFTHWDKKKTILLSSLPLTLCHQAAIIFLLNMFSQNHQDLSNSHSEHCEMRSQRKPFALQLTFQIYDLQQII